MMSASKSKLQNIIGLKKKENQLEIKSIF